MLICKESNKTIAGIFDIDLIQKIIKYLNFLSILYCLINFFVIGVDLIKLRFKKMDLEIIL